MKQWHKIVTFVLVVGLLSVGVCCGTFFGEPETADHGLGESVTTSLHECHGAVLAGETTVCPGSSVELLTGNAEIRFSNIEQDSAFGKAILAGEFDVARVRAVQALRDSSRSEPPSIKKLISWSATHNKLDLPADRVGRFLDYLNTGLT